MTKILIVDDEPQWRAAAERQLQSQLTGAFNITEASTVEGALKLVKSEQDFDLVVLDLNLPNEQDGISDRNNGIELLDYINKSKPATQVIIVSAFLDDVKDELFHLGATAFINKADVRSEHSLLEVVQKAIAQRDKTKIKPEPKKERLDALADMRKVLADEIEKYAPIKERTLLIPDEGNYELIKPLIGFKRDIEKHIVKFPFAKNVFLMMKFRDSNQDLGQFIIDNLKEHGLNGVRADQDEWNITKNTYNPIAVLYCCKYGIALFDEPEDHQAYSPNVAYELGMMHYQSKDCLILKHTSLPQIPVGFVPRSLLRLYTL